MIDRVLEFSVKQRSLVVVACVAVMLYGVWAAAHIPIDAFPDVTNVQVQIIGNGGGMSRRRWKSW